MLSFKNIKKKFADFSILSIFSVRPLNIGVKAATNDSEPFENSFEDSNQKSSANYDLPVKKTNINNSIEIFLKSLPFVKNKNMLGELNKKYTLIPLEDYLESFKKLYVVKKEDFEIGKLNIETVRPIENLEPKSQKTGAEYFKQCLSVLENFLGINKDFYILDFSGRIIELLPSKINNKIYLIYEINDNRLIYEAYDVTKRNKIVLDFIPQEKETFSAMEEEFKKLSEEKNNRKQMINDFLFDDFIRLRLEKQKFLDFLKNADNSSKNNRKDTKNLSNILDVSLTPTSNFGYNPSVVSKSNDETSDIIKSNDETSDIILDFLQENINYEQKSVTSYYNAIAKYSKNELKAVYKNRVLKEKAGIPLDFFEILSSKFLDENEKLDVIKEINGTKQIWDFAYEPGIVFQLVFNFRIMLSPLIKTAQLIEYKPYMLKDTSTTLYLELKEKTNNCTFQEVLAGLVNDLHKNHISQFQPEMVFLVGASLKPVYPKTSSKKLISNSYSLRGTLIGENNLASLIPFVIELTNDFGRKTRNDGSIRIPFCSIELQNFLPEKRDALSQNINLFTSKIQNGFEIQTQNSCLKFQPVMKTQKQELDNIFVSILSATPVGFNPSGSKRKIENIIQQKVAFYSSSNLVKELALDNNQDQSNINFGKRIF